MERTEEYDKEPVGSGIHQLLDDDHFEYVDFQAGKPCMSQYQQ
ncbi:hypothetical protein ACFP7A_02265 [Sporolactobacillus kofuensis]|uniref:Uncharacterized protein n=1 Tax=Sporolactobacillus kofuensis TaxID=269672 RepID=A0ABW1WDQ8_9BACL|nr:hypothetical protein [Sporolactobacillus kofuensis]